jgi:hypothetical protein
MKFTRSETLSVLKMWPRDCSGSVTLFLPLVQRRGLMERFRDGGNRLLLFALDAAQERAR